VKITGGSSYLFVVSVEYFGSANREFTEPNLKPILDLSV
jgi:hypothetical protein